MKTSMLSVSSSSNSSVFLTVLVILLSSVITTTIVTAQTDNDVENCGIDCGPYGVCMLDTRACVGDLCDYECQCDPGWYGKDCSLKIDRCEDPISHSPDEATICLNGGKCEDLKYPNGTIGVRCNCQSASGEAGVYAGHQCEFPAENVCEKDRVYSEYAFCVNGGSCNKLVEPGEPHPLCNCKGTGYEGRHCQFKAGTAPYEELIYISTGGYKLDSHVHANQQKDDDLSGGHKFLIVLCVFGFIGIVLSVYISRQRRKRNSRSVNEVTADLQLQPSTATPQHDDNDPDSQII